MAFNQFCFPFAAAFIAFVLLVLVTLSTPLIRSIYFIDVVLLSGSTKFGVLGYCGKLCSSMGFGYRFGTQITAATTTALVLFPTAAGVNVLLMLALFPLFCGPSRAHVPQFVLSSLSLAASACSIAAFIVGVYLAAAATSGFKGTGQSTSLGPSIWISLIAAVLNTLVAVNVALGICFGARLKRVPSYAL
ncbi:hypothetical protein C8Q72DRAFT_595734 [Fomitopsis betulina]|nr:hypothetical protein C8Q72DRAFT_595734 [Fomitopsis betulina]